MGRCRVKGTGRGVMGVWVDRCRDRGSWGSGRVRCSCRGRLSVDVWVGYWEWVRKGQEVVGAGMGYG